MKTETEYVMMKKKTREQQELKDQMHNKQTENKEYSYNPENNTDRNQEDFVSADSEGAAAAETIKVAGTADKCI